MSFKWLPSQTQTTHIQNGQCPYSLLIIIIIWSVSWTNATYSQIITNFKCILIPNTVIKTNHLSGSFTSCTLQVTSLCRKSSIWHPWICCSDICNTNGSVKEQPNAGHIKQTQVARTHTQTHTQCLQNSNIQRSVSQTTARYDEWYNHWKYENNCQLECTFKKCLTLLNTVRWNRHIKQDLLTCFVIEFNTSKSLVYSSTLLTTVNNDR
jgi:hypothetical protein